MGAELDLSATEFFAKPARGLVLLALLGYAASPVIPAEAMTHNNTRRGPTSGHHHGDDLHIKMGPVVHPFPGSTPHH